MITWIVRDRVRIRRFRHEFGSDGLSDLGEWLNLDQVDGLDANTMLRAVVTTGCWGLTPGSKWSGPVDRVRAVHARLQRFAGSQQTAQSRTGQPLGLVVVELPFVYVW